MGHAIVFAPRLSIQQNIRSVALNSLTLAEASAEARLCKNGWKAVVSALALVGSVDISTNLSI